MSLHFSANQYEVGYKPARLGNWEVGRTFPERPRQRRGPTKVIADDRGHLLPGVPRTHASPWGPLTQAIDPNVQEPSDQPPPPPATTHHSDDEAEDAGGEGGQLHVTGARLLSGAEGRDAEHGDPHHHQQESNRTSGTITPASFRRPAKAFSPSSVRSCRKPSAAGSRSSTVSTPSHDRILKEAAHLPADTVEDALLPRRPEEELVALTGSRALAIRLVDHPAPTNCTKYVVLRPNTAPSPAPSAKAPLLPKRPKPPKSSGKFPRLNLP